MNTVNKYNKTLLLIHISENGKRAEKVRICRVGGFSESSLNKVLRSDKMPEFDIRYGIYKATGIKLNELDEFPPVQIVKAS